MQNSSLAPFQQQGLLVKHVYGRDDKEQIARAVAIERGITAGDVCASTTVEMAPTFQHDKALMAMRSRPCLTIYHYRIDPESGWMHARIQAWFPFCIHVCIHGREWLSRCIDQAGRTALLPPGQLFPLDRGCCASPATVPGTTHGELDRETAGVRATVESAA